MKSSKMKLLGVGLALMFLAAGAVSQTLQRVHMHRAGMGHDMPFFALHDLTDAQRTQMRQIFHGSMAANKPLFEQEQQSHQAMIQLITSGTFDETKAQAIVNQSAQTHAQLELAHARVVSQAYQILTPEQKTELGEIMAKHQQRMEQRMQQQQAAPEQAPNQ